MPEKPAAPPKPAPAPPAWLEPLNRIRAIRANKPNPDALLTHQRLRIALVLESLPPEGWSDLEPDEYNYFRPILREHEEAKKERNETLTETAPPTSKEPKTRSPQTGRTPPSPS